MVHHTLMLLPLLALILFALLPWQVALPGFAIVAGTSFVVLRKVAQAQALPPVSGAQAMIGRKAVVVAAGGKEGEVRYEGEIWRAVSPAPLHAGQCVVIQDVAGLTLWVVPSSESGQ